MNKRWKQTEYGVIYRNFSKWLQLHVDPRTYWPSGETKKPSVTLYSSSENLIEITEYDFTGVDDKSLAEYVQQVKQTMLKWLK